MDTEMNCIPAMTDPLGKHWQQPADIREAPMDDTHVLLTSPQFFKLLEYSSTIPTGVYEGKCWKRHEKGKWLLCWYSYEDPLLCRINWREILL